MTANQFLIDDEGIYLPTRNKLNQKEIRGNFEWNSEKKDQVKFIPDPKGKFSVIEIL
jgi:hypothetical protein